MIAEGRRLRPTVRTALREIAIQRQRELEAEFLHCDWAVEGQRYIKKQQRLGSLEMNALLEAAGLERPLSREQKEAVLAMAAEVYLGVTPGDARIIPLPGVGVRLEVRDCPINHRLEREEAGNSACSCFARRRGWYEALGGDVWDQLETNLKWGDPYCSVTVFTAPK